MPFGRCSFSLTVSRETRMEWNAAVPLEPLQWGYSIYELDSLTSCNAAVPALSGLQEHHILRRFALHWVCPLASCLCLCPCLFLGLPWMGLLQEQMGCHQRPHHPFDNRHLSAIKFITLILSVHAAQGHKLRCTSGKALSYRMDPIWTSNSTDPKQNCWKCARAPERILFADRFGK